MPLVAGIDSSTQSCKVVIRDADDGTLIRSGRAPHPPGTEVDPRHWETALAKAIEAAGGLHDVAAISVGAQQHGMVALDESGEVVRPALLWNDTRSAAAAATLTQEFGGPSAWAHAVGSVPVASFTISKLRWLAETEPENAARLAAVCLPHDWLTWRLGGTADLGALRTDRSDASGTGYWSASTGYREDLLELAVRRVPELPQVLAPHQPAGTTPGGLLLGPGAGDNAASALGLGARAGDVIVSIGTSGVACAISTTPTGDETGTVAGFADATGHYLPLVATINAAQVLEATAQLLELTLDGLSTLALRAPPGSDGLVLVPYFEGERTPNKPNATGALHGMRLDTTTPAHLARAAIEGVLCGLADAVDALVVQGITIQRVFLIGGAARSPAVREIAAALLDRPVLVPPPGEYAADGAARQAAWTLSGGSEPAPWSIPGTSVIHAQAQPAVRARYAEARELTLSRE
ncbi:MAG TPA: xylulokinase [Frankiaceae bacterium]|nr:xylulokinase [Frankiaceae bacterium]